MFQYLLRDYAAEQVHLIPGFILNVTRQLAGKRGINRFVGLLVEVPHTSQQRCQTASAVSISTLTVQQHHQLCSQVGIKLAKQRNHAPGDASTVAAHIQSVRYRLVL
ncbi:hypothetical protein [Enterobacter soli]|uniref:hypothetical protein n=1 Tax=Enterobacter soli TaxID=885040 RepID=UPI0036D2DA68